MPPLSCTHAAALLLAAAAVHAAKWTYTGEHRWSKKYPFCGGAFQSPVDITPLLLRFDPALRPIAVQNYNLSPNEQLTLGNNGHSVQISLPSEMHISSLRHRYTAAQLHLHWGSAVKPAGSEHTLNGKQYPAELHIVHYNSDKYPNISAAVDKSDGLAVLAVLVEIGEFNPVYEQFIKYLKDIKYKGQKVQVPGFDMKGLLPPRLDEYYRYDGSLTTPPCYPSVLWTIFRSPVTVSRKQFQALATNLFFSNAQESLALPMKGNYRRPHLIDNRVVLASFKEGRGLYPSLPLTCHGDRKRAVQKLLVGDLDDLADGERDLKALKNGPMVKSFQQLLNSHPWQKSRAGRPLATPGLVLDELIFGALEHAVAHGLRQSTGKAALIQELRDVVYPELNLRSFLQCKSDLAPATIGHIVHAKPTDRDAVAGKAPQTYQALPWLEPMEWED